MHKYLPVKRSGYKQDKVQYLYNSDFVCIQESIFKNDTNIWICGADTGYVKNLQQAIENVLEIQIKRLKEGNKELIPDIMRLTGWLERVKVNFKAKV